MINKLKYLFNKRKEKKGKGFTLVELLAVIVILAVIMVITIPTVLGNMKEARQQAFDTVGETMEKYLVDNYNNCKLGNVDIAKYDEVLFKTDGSCQLNDNISDALITNSGYSTNDIEKVDVTEDGRGNYGVYLYPKNDGEFYDVKKELTNSIPNKPDLSIGLVPIKYNGTNWVVTTSNDPEWFDYANQKWANAASLKEGTSKEPGTVLIVPDGDSITEANSNVLAMFVWVPRFSYTKGCHDGVPSNNTESFKCIGYKIDGASDLKYEDGKSSSPGAIDIKFVSTKTKDDPGVNLGKFPMYSYIKDSNGMPSEDRMPDNWYTHPAFTFGDEELSGIWVGKFETSIDSNDPCFSNIKNKTGSSDGCEYNEVNPRILPNVLPLFYQNIFNKFMTAKNFTLEDNRYGLSTLADSHMMKNIEWGAVTYLSQSIYGKYGNSSYQNENKEIYISDGIYTGRSSGNVSLDKNPGSETGTYKYDVETNGTGASTTGNIYGIYDMSGGSYEFVMGNYNNAPGNSGLSQSWLNSSDNKKYFEIYTNNGNLKQKLTTETIGTATAETKRWYNNMMTETSDTGIWLIRGGYRDKEGEDDIEKTGIFYYNWSNATSHYARAFRTVISAN